MTYRYAQATGRTKRSEIRELLKWTRKPGIISFGGGLPDSNLFPIRDLAAITDEVLTKKGYLALNYGPTEGEADFLAAIADHMKTYGDPASIEQICVTSSSQQGLDLMTHLFIDPGEPVLMELPSYLGAIQSFQRGGADMRGIPMDDEGIRPDLLEKELKSLAAQNKPPRFIYLIPDFQNPSGINMTLERRQQVLEISRRFAVPLIEDSPYREMSFAGKILPSLWSLSGGRGVIQLKTFSKMLLPGMRMGWITGEPEIIDQAVKMKQSTDLCTSSFSQLILAAYMQKGKMHQMIRDAIALYIPKRDKMLKGLEENMPKAATWSKPQGGMFLWVTLPEGLDTAELFMIAIEHKVAYVIGRPFHCDGSGANTLRLNYSFPSLEQIETGIAFLGRAVSEFIKAKIKP